MEIFHLEKPYIQLDQLLKLHGVIATGGQITFLLQDQIIKINGIVATERRKKIFPGDIVEVADTVTIQVTAN